MVLQLASYPTPLGVLTHRHRCGANPMFVLIAIQSI